MRRLRSGTTAPRRDGVSSIDPKKSRKRAWELTRKLRALRHTEGERWCGHGTKLIDRPTGDGTMEDWYEQNRRFPQYWLHVMYLANPKAAKRLFADTLAEVFADPQNEAQQRLFDLAKTLDPGDSEALAEKRPEDPEWWLLYRACTFMRDAYTLCPVWATEVLISVLATDGSDRRAAIALGKRWRAVTTVAQWAGMDDETTGGDYRAGRGDARGKLVS